MAREAVINAGHQSVIDAGHQLRNLGIDLNQEMIDLNQAMDNGEWHNSFAWPWYVMYLLHASRNVQIFNLLLFIIISQDYSFPVWRLICNYYFLLSIFICNFNQKDCSMVFLAYVAKRFQFGLFLEICYKTLLYISWCVFLFTYFSILNIFMHL